MNAARTPRFAQARSSSTLTEFGVQTGGWTWTAKFADMDLDGFVDLMITNGMASDVMDSDYEERTRQIGATTGYSRPVAAGAMRDHLRG